MNAITINGYDTFYEDCNKSKDPYLIIAIPQNADKDIAQICGQIICNHLIKQVSYEFVEGTRFIKAYY